MMVKLKNRTPEELVVLMMGMACVSGLTYFGIINDAKGEYPIMIGAWLSALSTFVMLIYVVKTSHVKGPGLFLALLTVGGVTAIIMIRGPGEVPFLYPMVICAYFLVVPNLALLIGLSSLAILASDLRIQMDVFEFAKFIFSILGCIFLSYTFATIRNRQRDELLRLSSKDGLTGAGNRRALDEKLAELINIFRRSKSNMSLLLLDLDNFKSINDREGHGVGDQILIRITEIIQSRIRITDSLYRYGGDEFVVLLAGSNLNTSMNLAEDIRARVEINEAKEGTNISLSLGVAQYVAGQSPEQWLNAADEALLKAKREGRNRVLAATA